MGSKASRALIALFAAASALFGAGHAAWAVGGSAPTGNGTHVVVPQWGFEDADFAKIGNLGGLSYLTAERETGIVRGSSEAVRLTNTAGTQTKSHTFVISTDREYTVGEIKEMKVEFDYYHIEKRQQQGKGFPKVQLAYNGTGKGNTQGGGEAMNAKSPFVATSLEGGWWHLEYFITALCPTMADHGDSPIGASQRINGIKVVDDAIYDFASGPAFVVVDNARFSAEPAERLGLFNRGTSFASGKYYWLKVCWVGELRSCVMAFDDDSMAEQDTASTKSPFYIKGLRAGTVTVTATLTIGDGTQVLSISSVLTIT